MLGKHPAKGKKRKTKAETIMGEAGFANQRQRAARVRQNAREAGKSIDKASTIETIKRVSEYKKARGDYKAPKHGRKKK